MLKASQKAAQPVTPQGEVPDGVEVTSRPGTLQVRTTKDPQVADAFIASVRAELAQLTMGGE